MVDDLYHIMLEPRRGVTLKQVEQAMNFASDWFRYRNDCWVVYTAADSQKLYNQLESLVKPDGVLLITRLNASDYGWMSQKFWDWLAKYQ